MAEKQGQVERYNAAYKGLRAMLEENKDAIAMALPRHVNEDRMLRICMTSLRTKPELLECDPKSFLSAVLMSSALGLEPDGIRGEAYLLKRWNGKRRQFEVQFMAGYQGLMKLARNSGELKGWFAAAVRDGDEFEFEYGSKAFLRHKPADDAGNLTRAYAGAVLEGGYPVFRVLYPRDIERAKRASSSRTKDGDLVGPWVTDEEEMWIKTAIRRVCKILPSSAELSLAVGLDERAERGLAQNLGAFTGLAPENEIDEDGNPVEPVGDRLKRRAQSAPKEEERGEPKQENAEPQDEPRAESEQKPAPKKNGQQRVTF